ncbi:MAG: hypothetical protein LAP13_07610 [Acidobacteriia bacterium]|nr:hypothetical protein [Terriglobia bacterium]
MSNNPSALPFSSLRVLLTSFAAFCLAATALGQQPSQQNRSRPFGPDACGPADPTYIRTAEETGGLPMFLQRSEVAKSMKFMGATLGGNRVDLLWATDTLRGDSSEFAVPVDSTVENITFAMSTNTKGTSLVVLNPAGEEIKTGDTGADVTELNCGRFLTLKRPAPGDYRLRVTGSGKFWLEAEGKSEIFTFGLEFVELGGRPGHQGMFRISGQPLADRPATLECSIQKEAQDVAFRLISPAGKTLQTIKLQPIDNSGDDIEFSGTFKLPATPFRIAVTGKNSKGEAFQRIQNTLYHAETVRVTPESLLEVERPAGKTTTITFTVHNVGAPATFRIIVADARRFVSRAEPKELLVGKDGSAKVEVDLTVPASATAGIGDDVSITAQSLTGPPTYNGAVQPVSVVAPRKAP